jgi:autotransporter-associated beta strand protein
MYPKRNLRHVLLSSCCFAVVSFVALSPVGATTYTVATDATQTVTTQIAGTDNVLLTGGGTLVLANASNNYTGGTQVVGASLLQIDNDAELGAGNLVLGNGTTTGQLVFAGTTTLASTRTVTLNAGSEIINTGAYTDTIAGVISGTGKLVKTGTGTLVLTATDTYSGTTTISAGTLQIGAGGTTGSIVGAISNAGALVFNRSDAITFAGAISGTGTLTQAGSGKLTLTGANTFTGGTTINTGSTLAMAGGGTLTSSPLTVNGTFDISGITATTLTAKSLAGTGSVVLGAKTLGLNSSPATPFYGVISGTGNLQINSGTTTLAGDNIYTGTTTIASGATLQLGNQTSTGSIASTTVVDNGTLTFSHSDTFTFSSVISGTGAVKQNGVDGVLILNAANTYTGLTTASVGTLVIGDATHTTAKVGGAATVATSGTLTGYGTIAGTLTNQGVVKTGYGSVGTLTVGGSYSQTSTGSLIAEVSASGASLLKVGGAATLSGTFRAVFEDGTYAQSIFPIITASSVSGTFTDSSGVSGTLAYGVVYPTSGTEVDLVVVPRTVVQVYDDIVTAALDNAHNLNDIALDQAAFSADDRAKDAPAWSTWVQGLYGSNHLASGNGASAFNAHDTGVIGGIGYHFGDGVSLNAALGYISDVLSLGDASARADGHGVFASAILHVPVQRFAVNIGGFYMSNSADVQRVTGSGGITQAQLHSTVRGLSGEFTYALRDGDVMPFAKWTSAAINYNPFTETGGGFYNLAGFHGSTHISLADLGLRASHPFTLPGGQLLRPHLEVGMEFNPWPVLQPVNATLSSTQVYGFEGIAPSTDKLSAVMRVGVAANVYRGLNITADLAGRRGTKQEQGVFSLGAVYRF